MEDSQRRLEEKLKYINELIERANEKESEDSIDVALEKLNLLVKSFNRDKY